ncbi:MAG: primosomal protein N' [Firmicutes bacterium HGW-Firmicutes-15]|nr:MAG: primosomal protein N' [Firmicutes bacterium HGW-Firmicutes-15]
MKCVELVMNLPTSKLDGSYTYSVPEKLLSEATFGKRVLVDFRNRKVEGFIVGELEEYEVSAQNPIKSLIKVLDVEAVFDRSLLALARWMAEYYLCPLSLTLNIMVPRILHHKTKQVILPAIDEAGFKKLGEKAFNLNHDLFTELWQHGEIELSHALKYASIGELTDWEKSGFITGSGVYRMGHEYKKGYVYALGQFESEKDLSALKRKAPRQAEAMELLLSASQLDRDYMDRTVSPATMRALIKKGFVVIERKTNILLGRRVQLNDEQDLALKQMEKALQSREMRELLLFGVTGSGKTEVYLQAAQIAIANGKGVIVLVPEIALTRQFVDVFAARIGEMAVLHSGMSPGERYDEWRRIKRGEARLVLGARSAVFAPVADLGLIIIDEEQEGSFKQEELPRYHVRDVGRQRAYLESAVILLGSATPSLETFHSAQEGSAKLLVLKKRVGGGQIPRVIIEDLRKAFKNESRSLISPFLRDKMGQNLSRGEQIIVFINRRGYSPMTICWECGNIASCPSCSVAMTYHQDIQQNVCHYCNNHVEQKSECSSCGSKHLQLIGAGTQKIEEEVRSLFPEARVERLDMDSSKRKGIQKSILDRMKRKEIDILIGTQMVAKGLDFPNVSLVGIVDADSILNIPDFRAGERCFQLLVQAAGRAGRSNTAGEVVIQTYNPDNPIIRLAGSQDYRRFYEQEISLRKLLVYPPYTQLLRIVFSSEAEAKVQQSANAIAHRIEEIIDASEEEIMVLGPASCPIYKIRNRFRYQIIIKCASLSLLRSIGKYILTTGVPKDVKMDMDFNPISTI